MLFEKSYDISLSKMSIKGEYVVKANQLVATGARRRASMVMLAASALVVCGVAHARRQPLMDMTVLNQPPPQIAPEMQGVVAWKTLAEVTRQRTVLQPGTPQQKIVIEPQFAPSIKRLHEQRVRLNGYMIPLEVKHGQQRFLLSAYPQGCAFCTPDTAHQFADIEAKSAIKSTAKLLVLEGILQILDHRDESGLLYRLREAKLVD